MVDYTTASGFVTDAQGRRQFVDRNLQSGVQGTDLVEADFNMNRNELVNLVLLAGLVPNGSDHTQVGKAVQELAAAAAAAGVSGTLGKASTDLAGVALYWSTALSSPVFTYGTGDGQKTVGLLTLGGGNVAGDMDWGSKAAAGTVTQRFWSAGPPATGDATPDATLTVTGGTPGTANAGTLALQTGTLDLSGVKSTLLPNATLPQQPVVMGQVATLTPGRLLKIQRFDTAGTFTFTPTPGANFWRVRVQGAGGSGGSAAYNEGASVSVAHSGGGGTFAEAEYSLADIEAALTDGSIPVTVGAGAPRLVTSGAINGLPGNNGGASSFGSLLTCVGGYGGNAGTWSNSAGWSSSNSIQSAVATGTNIKRCIRGGSPGAAMCFAMSSAGLLSFPGGGSAYGDGAPAVDGASQNAWDATNPGTGGSGICLPQNQASAMPGGAGADGLVEIEEWLVDESA
ncbi:hypothetical protein [Komagataeibacter xylinus]|uniref:glycine-rich domain-containing protein n=1 Tax=Komagataeibacter xylinus TaxID=28448 RepID=UPI00280B0C2F|nr:hypothetical protein [Komagataeibacter xylinus]